MGTSAQLQKICAVLQTTFADRQTSCICLFVSTVYANLRYNQLSRRLKATLEGYSKKQEVL